MKKVQRTEQHNIKRNSEFGKFIDDYCIKSKNLYNYANYILRQEFVNERHWIGYNDLFQMVKDSEPYKELGSNIGQGTLRILDKSWKSFFVAIKDWSKNPSKYLGRPRLPKYRPKDGRFILSLDSNKSILFSILTSPSSPAIILNFTTSPKPLSKSRSLNVWKKAGHIYNSSGG